MAAPLGAYVLRNSNVLIETVDYANQLTRAEITVEQETQTLRTLVPDGVVQDVDTAVYTFNLSGIQDMKLAQGLARVLEANDGLDLDVDFTPKIGGVHKTFVCVGKAVSFGGEQGGWATFEVALPIKGKPVTVDPV